MGAADPRLRADAARDAELWFRGRVDRSLRRVRMLSEGRHLDMGTLSLVGDLLQGSL